MAISPTYAGYTNTGHDISVVVTMPGGQAVTIFNVTEFTSQQEVTEIRKPRLDNSVAIANLPKLWHGTISFDRADDTEDLMFAALDDNWYSGADYQNGQIAIYIATKGNGNSGESSTIIFHDVAFRFEDVGTWRSDELTTCRISFDAGRRVVNGIGGARVSNSQGVQDFAVFSQTG